MPTTLRTELDRLGFEWDDGSLVTQDGAGYQVPGLGRKVKKNDPLLEQTFPNGPLIHLPRFWASDKKAVYVCRVTPSGSGLERIEKTPEAYLAGTAIPYPDA